MADPGFPIGRGHGPIREGMDLQCGHFLAKMYAKMKELGPIGGHAPSTPLDPPMHLGLYNKFILVTRKQVLELYVTAIERKTLYSVRVPHTAFPNAIRIQQLQLNTTTKENNTPTTRSMLPT